MNLNPAAVLAAVTAAALRGSPLSDEQGAGVPEPHRDPQRVSEATTLWRVATHAHARGSAVTTATDYDDEPAAIRAETRAHREGKQAFRYPVEVQP